MIWVVTALVVACASPSQAGFILADATDGTILEAVDADTPHEVRRAGDLLLTAHVRRHIAGGALAARSRIAVHAVADDPGPTLASFAELETGELLQLLLLMESRTAARSLAAATHADAATLRDLATALELGATSVPDGWEPGDPIQTSLRDLIRMGLLIVESSDLRRRLALDGVPIGDGAVIVRARAPLLAIRTSGAPAPAAPLVVETRGALRLLVATGTEEVAGVLDDGFRRYERVALIRAGNAVGRQVPVQGGSSDRLRPVAAETFEVTARRGAPPPLTLRLQLPASIAAPIADGAHVGELVVERDGAVVAVVPLVAPEPIDRGSWLGPGNQRPARKPHSR